MKRFFACLTSAAMMLSFGGLLPETLPAAVFAEQADGTEAEEGLTYDEETATLTLSGEISGRELTAFVRNVTNPVRHIVAAEGTVFPENASWLFESTEAQGSLFAEVETADFSKADTSKTTNMAGMFHYCLKLQKVDLSGFDTSNVIDFQHMFGMCESLTELDLSSFDTANAEIMEYMFWGDDKLETIYVSDQWSMEKVVYSTFMFIFDMALTGGNGTVFDESKDDGTYARIDTADAPGYFTRKQPEPVETTTTTIETTTTTETTSTTTETTTTETTTPTTTTTTTPTTTPTTTRPTTGPGSTSTTTTPTTTRPTTGPDSTTTTTTTPTTRPTTGPGSTTTVEQTTTVTQETTTEPTVTEPNETETLTGDVSGDGVIDTADAMLLARFLKFIVSDLPNPDAADVDGDGAVASADAMILMRYVNGWKGYDVYFKAKS